MFDEIFRRSLRLIAACLSHYCDLVRFFAWHGIVCAPDTSLIGRNLIACSPRYNFKICDAAAGCIDFDNAVKMYRCSVINDDCVTVAPFLHDLTDNRDYYASCLLTKINCVILSSLCQCSSCIFSLHSDVFLISSSFLLYSVFEFCVLLLYLYFVYHVIINKVQVHVLVRLKTFVSQTLTPD